MKSLNRTKMFVLVSLAIAACLAVFRGAVLAKFIEPETGFYIVDTNIGTWFGVATVLAILFVVAAAYFTKKEQAPEGLNSRSAAVVFSSSLCAYLFFSVFAYGMYLVFTSRMTSPLFVVQMLLCIPCGINHLTICSKEVRGQSTAYAYLSMSTAVFFALRLIEVFMDVSKQINTSQRSLEILMLCSMMMFFLAESDYVVNKKNIQKKSAVRYFVFGLCVIIFTAATVVPYLVVSEFVWMAGRGLVIMDVLECCIMIFAASRLLTSQEA